MTKPKSDAKKKPAPKERRLSVFTTELPVKLTTEELIAAGQKLAQCEIDLRNEEEHAEAVKKDLKTREGLLLVKRSQIAGIVRSGKEPRPVQVEAWARYSEGVYEEIRQDTGEVLQQTRRRLMESERQVPLPLGPDEKKLGDLKTDAKQLAHAAAEDLFAKKEGASPKPKTIGKKKADKPASEEPKPAV